jgi:hypothetical protein
MVVLGVGAFSYERGTPVNVLEPHTPHRGQEAVRTIFWDAHPGICLVQQGYLDHKQHPNPLAPPQGPMLSPTVGS